MQYRGHSIVLKVCNVYGMVYALHPTVVNKGLVSFVTILDAEKKFIGELMTTVDAVSGTYKISIDD